MGESDECPKLYVGVRGQSGALVALLGEVRKVGKISAFEDGQNARKLAVHGIKDVDCDSDDSRCVVGFFDSVEQAPVEIDVGEHFKYDYANRARVVGTGRIAEENMPLTRIDLNK